MKKVNTLPPIEIYDILHEAEVAGILIPTIVDKWWEEETAINQGAVANEPPTRKGMPCLIQASGEVSK
jgi:hypothetical protein